MLSYLVLENFRSFKQRTKIDLQKTNYTILPQNVAENDILKGLVFVGGNGSGKSTILEAVRLLLDMMFGENKIHLALYYSLLSSRREFSLEYGFDVQSDKIVYKVACDIVNGLLYEELSKNDTLLFKRKGRDARGYWDGNEKVYDEKLLKPDGLFLRTLYFNGQLVIDNSISEWIEFLKKSTYINAAPAGQELLEFTDNNRTYYENGGIEKINKFLEEIDYEQRIFYSNEARGDYTDVKLANKILFYERKGIHMPIPFLSESLGNRTLIKILSSYIPVIENGGMLLIDEFSAGLHSELENVLIKYFMEHSKDAQLLLVSHSATLLSNSVLRPDQEYAVEFDGANGSKVNRFSNMQPRNSQNISKMYLSGVFGGKPMYGENNKN